MFHTSVFSTPLYKSRYITHWCQDHIVKLHSVHLVPEAIRHQTHINPQWRAQQTLVSSLLHLRDLEAVWQHSFPSVHRFWQRLQCSAGLVQYIWSAATRLAIGPHAVVWNVPIINILSDWDIWVTFFLHLVHVWPQEQEMKQRKIQTFHFLLLWKKHWQVIGCPNLTALVQLSITALQRLPRATYSWAPTTYAVTTWVNAKCSFYVTISFIIKGK